MQKQKNEKQEIKDLNVLTMMEAMEYLRTTRPTVKKLIKEGKIKANKVGRNYRFLKSELDKFLRGE